MLNSEVSKKLRSGKIGEIQQFLNIARANVDTELNANLAVMKDVLKEKAILEIEHTKQSLEDARQHNLMMNRIAQEEQRAHLKAMYAIEQEQKRNVNKK